MRLKLKCDEPLSNFAFIVKLRRYTTPAVTGELQPKDDSLVTALVEAEQSAEAEDPGATSAAVGKRESKGKGRGNSDERDVVGGLLGGISEVGRCRFTPV
jgi:hypothetical protein